MSDPESGPKLEYNLAGGLALSVRPEDFRELCGQLVAEGYGSACLFPFRALTKKGEIEALKDSGLSIVHLEQAWNPTPEDNLAKATLAGLMGYYKRFRGDKSQPPILQDAAFPGKATGERLFQELLRAFPEAKVISYDVDAKYDRDRLLLGINQSITQDLPEFIDKTEARGVSLFFDPHNIISNSTSTSLPGKPTKERNSWKRQFDALASTGRLEVVDIHPVGKNDVDDLIKEGGGMLKELAQEACRIKSVKFLRVEIPLPLKLQFPGINSKARGDFLGQIAEALKEPKK